MMNSDFGEIGRATSGPTMEDTKASILLDLIKDILDEDDREHIAVTNRRVWDDKATCFRCGVLWPCAIERAFMLLEGKK